MNEGNPFSRERKPLIRHLVSMKEGNIYKLATPFFIEGKTFQTLECLREIEGLEGTGLYYEVKSVPVEGGDAKTFFVKIFNRKIIRVSSVPQRVGDPRRPVFDGEDE